jgi:ADP-ribose pyrophosphatase YjhB (NUDIX family)
MEETGVEAEFVRVVGIGENPVGHYVQLKPANALPESWEHIREDGPVHCRWIPVSADADVWGLRGDFIHALVRSRVVAYVTRGRELLVFEHAGVLQVPAGRIDYDETLEMGLLREVEEETGLTGLQIVGQLADADEVERLYGVFPHRSWVFHALAEKGGVDAWTHAVTGTGMDAGMVFQCRWIPLEGELPLIWGRHDPLAERLRASITEP